MSSNIFWTRPYEFPEPYYKVPVPGTYPPAYQKIPVNDTTRAAVHPTVCFPQTFSCVYLPMNNLAVQTQPQIHYRQPQLWYQGYII